MPRFAQAQKNEKTKESVDHELLLRQLEVVTEAMRTMQAENEGLRRELQTRTSGQGTPQEEQNKEKEKGSKKEKGKEKEKGVELLILRRQLIDAILSSDEAWAGQDCMAAQEQADWLLHKYSTWICQLFSDTTVKVKKAKKD